MSQPGLPAAAPSRTFVPALSQRLRGVILEIVELVNKFDNFKIDPSESLTQLGHACTAWSMYGRLSPADTTDSMTQQVLVLLLQLLKHNSAL
jgi:hypothetical protein